MVKSLSELTICLILGTLATGCLMSGASGNPPIRKTNPQGCHLSLGSIENLGITPVSDLTSLGPKEYRVSIVDPEVSERGICTDSARPELYYEISVYSPDGSLIISNSLKNTDLENFKFTLEETEGEFSVHASATLLSPNWDGRPSQAETGLYNPVCRLSLSGALSVTLTRSIGSSTSVITPTVLSRPHVVASVDPSLDEGECQALAEEVESNLYIRSTLRTVPTNAIVNHTFNTLDSSVLSQMTVTNSIHYTFTSSVVLTTNGFSQKSVSVDVPSYTVPPPDDPVHCFVPSVKGDPEKAVTAPSLKKCFEIFIQ